MPDVDRTAGVAVACGTTDVANCAAVVPAGEMVAVGAVVAVGLVVGESLPQAANANADATTASRGMTFMDALLNM